MRNNLLEFKHDEQTLVSIIVKLLNWWISELFQGGECELYDKKSYSLCG